MSDFTLPSEILDGKEITFGVFRELVEVVSPAVFEMCGDSEAIEELVPIHHFSEKAKLAKILLNNLDSPSWETVVWGHSYGSADGTADYDAIEAAIVGLQQ